jgi:hypothetical protein
VIDEEGATFGVFELQELVSFLVQNIGPTVSVDTFEKNLHQRTVEQIMRMATRNLCAPVNPEVDLFSDYVHNTVSSLQDSCILALDMFGSGVYRAPVVDLDHKLVGLLTQTDLIVEATKALRADNACRAMATHSLEHYGLGACAQSNIGKI